VFLWFPAVSPVSTCPVHVERVHLVDVSGDETPVAGLYPADTDRPLYMQFAVGGTQVTVTALMLVSLLFGAGIAGYGGYDYLQQSEAVDDAVTVETTVVDTEISSSGRRALYRVSAEHTYQYQGTEYTSEDVFPGSLAPRYATRNDAEDVLDDYEPGETATAYVDPESPNEAFLERDTAQTPFWLVGFGGLMIALTTLHAVGPRNPGQETKLRPASEHESTRYDSLFGYDRGAVNHLSKRLLPVSLAVFLLALLTAVFFTATSSGQATLTDPAGLALVTAAVAWLGAIGALVLYDIWSFTEYRRLRERIPEPRPPSPFRHPSRLVTILYTDDNLDTYGRRVKRTASVFAVTLFMTGMFLYILATAA
jgi:hypothetical protein